MSERKELGKIKHATFGRGGYQNAQIGLSLTFEGADGWGVSFFSGGWSATIEWSESCKWTERDRDADFAKAVRLLDATLIAAKKSHVAELVGVPVEVTFDQNVLDSWRVLTEVL